MIPTLSFAPALVYIYLLKVYSFIQYVFTEHPLGVSPQASSPTRYCPSPHGANSLIRETDVNLITKKLISIICIKCCEEKVLNVMKVKPKRPDLGESSEVSLRKWDLTQDLEG